MIGLGRNSLRLRRSESVSSPQELLILDLNSFAPSKGRKNLHPEHVVGLFKVDWQRCTGRAERTSARRRRTFVRVCALVDWEFKYRVSCIFVVCLFFPQQTRNPKECYGFRSRQKNFLSNRFSVNNMDEQIFIFISAEFKHKKNYMNLFIDNILDNSMREE